MKNEEEDGDDFDDFDDFENFDYKNLLNQQNALEGFHLHLLEKKISDRILNRSIRVCEKSFFWRFYSINSKISTISRVYENFINLLKIEE